MTEYRARSVAAVLLTSADPRTATGFGVPLPNVWHQRRAQRVRCMPGLGISVAERLATKGSDAEVQGAPVVDMQAAGGSVTTTVPPAGT